MKRLHWRIYFALLLSLLVFGLLLGFLWRRVFDPPPDLAELSRREIEAVMPAADASHEAHQKVADRLRASWGASVTIFAADGSILGSSGPWPPLVAPQGPGRLDRRNGPPRVRAVRPGRRERGSWARFWGEPRSFAFADGRSVLLRQGPRFDGRRPGPFLMLVFVGVAVAAATYPVARGLTKRLERLQGGVERLGEGDFSTRVVVEGDDEIGRLAESFNRTAEHLERLVGGHKTLLANASHELRSPLARLRMVVELLPEASAENRERREQLMAEATTNLAELDQLVGEILISSRLDARPEGVSRETVDLDALVREESTKAGAVVTGGLSQLGELTGDSRLLRRALRNLLDNARRHGQPPIAVTLSDAAGEVEISVQDSGSGVAEVERERLFEPFYRPAGRSESDGGQGLGLALVRQIARAHGGDARLDSAGGGTRFVIRLPKH